jgi:hypothetical protein
MRLPKLDPATIPSASARVAAQLAFRALSSVLDYDRADMPSQVRGLPRHWRAVFTVCWLEFEVCNGGHHQFFWNWEGKLHAETLADLDLIGAADAATILRDALRVFKSHDYVRKKAVAGGSLLDFAAHNPERELSPLDHAFYALRKRPTKFLGAFIKANLNLFAS